MIYPDDADPNSQILTGEDALISVEDLAVATAIDESSRVQTDSNSQEIYMTTGLVTKINTLSDETFACTKCDKIYNARRNLVRHINSECGKEPKYTCTYCDYRNYRRNEIVNHMKKKHQKHSEMCMQLV